MGFYIFHILAKLSFSKFAHKFVLDEVVASLAIDEFVSSNYAHTAILNKHLKSKYIKPRFSKLIAKNRISYSGKTRQFRLENPRDFQYKKIKENNIILVDDIITTGSTLSQATTLLQKQDKTILFCLTLADVQR